MTFVPNPTPEGEYFHIGRSGSGGLLDPPGHPHHTHSVTSKYSQQPLKSAVNDEYIPTRIRERARKLLDDAKLVCSELWLRHTYGYFKNCYSADGEDRNVQNCLIVGQRWYVDKGSKYDSLNRSDEVLRADDPRVVPEHHLAYLYVKKYFPDHEPRLDLIADASGGYGSKPCRKCGTRLQYEVKVDAFAEAITAKLTCPKGGNHEAEEQK